jgi:hypothetical protein
MCSQFSTRRFFVVAAARQTAVATHAAAALRWCMGLLMDFAGNDIPSVSNPLIPVAVLLFSPAAVTAIRALVAAIHLFDSSSNLFSPNNMNLLAFALCTLVFVFSSM